MKVCSVCYICCEDDVFSCPDGGHSSFIEDHSRNPAIITGYLPDHLLNSDATENIYRAANLAGLRYFSPEHHEAMPVYAATDLYSLGIALCKMLAGNPPFHSNRSDEILRGLAIFDIRALLTAALIDSFSRTPRMGPKTSAAFASQLRYIEQLIEHLLVPSVISIPSVVNNAAPNLKPRPRQVANPSAAIPVVSGGRSSCSSRSGTIQLIDAVPANEAPVILVNDPLPAGFVLDIESIPQITPFPAEQYTTEVWPAFEPFTFDRKRFAEIPLVEEISEVDRTDFGDGYFPAMPSEFDDEPENSRPVSRFVVDLTQGTEPAKEPLIFSQYSVPRSHRYLSPLKLTVTATGLVILIISVLAIGNFLNGPPETRLAEKIADRAPRREKLLPKSGEPKIITIEPEVNSNEEFAANEDSRDTDLNDQTIEEYISRISDPDSSDVKKTATLQAALVEKSDENQISRERQDDRTKPNELKTKDDRFETILNTPGSTAGRTVIKPVPKRNETNITSRPRIVKGRVIP